jgi:hypothetical protein
MHFWKEKNITPQEFFSGKKKKKKRNKKNLIEENIYLTIKLNKIKKKNKLNIKKK